MQFLFVLFNTFRFIFIQSFIVCYWIKLNECCESWLQRISPLSLLNSYSITAFRRKYTHMQNRIPRATESSRSNTHQPKGDTSESEQENGFKGKWIEGRGSCICSSRLKAKRKVARGTRGHVAEGRGHSKRQKLLQIVQLVLG